MVTTFGPNRSTSLWFCGKQHRDLTPGNHGHLSFGGWGITWSPLAKKVQIAQLLCGFVAQEKRNLISSNHSSNGHLYLGGWDITRLQLLNRFKPLDFSIWRGR